MLNSIKWLILTLIVLSSGGAISAWIMLQASLPQLDGQLTSAHISDTVSLQRDQRGHAVINAQSQHDAMYALGFAHGQDRFLQMDLSRRYAAGELAEWFGKGAIKSDEKMRFHQFRQRARAILAILPNDQREMLERYSQGVNDAIANFSVTPYEYVLTSFSMRPWHSEDSILVVFSMYADLQLGQVDLDLARTRLADHFGPEIAQFFALPSPYQAALDGSIVNAPITAIPAYPDSIEKSTASLNSTVSLNSAAQHFSEPLPIGSNNWAVGGGLTDTGKAMLANDMHLTLRVPTTWYRTSLSYIHNDERITVHGVSLPGSPGIVVGSNDSIAWGFTNANFDNVDLIRLAPDTPTHTVTEVIALPQGEHQLTITMSDYGPVKQIGNDLFALRWVAHTDYAVNFSLADMAHAHDVKQALNSSNQASIPLQNLVVVDALGNIAWRPIGAVTGRAKASFAAISPSQFDAVGWQSNQTQLPSVMNPAEQRIWTANARVIDADALPQFGDGGYALGARQQQIKERLFEHRRFDENTFNQILFDNEARFLQPWQRHLIELLSIYGDQFEQALHHLNNWENCACADSVGYTLVRHYRSELINTLFAPFLAKVQNDNVNANGLLRQIEPALWRLIDSQPQDWLPENVETWQALHRQTFERALEKLQHRYGSDWHNLAWGNVNALTIKHPFAAQLPLFGSKLNLPSITGYGDNFMPAVQRPSFGASERFVAQPGRLQNAFLAIPGGQSLHPLSDFYAAGFDDYANKVKTPLLPQKIEHSLTWSPSNTPTSEETK